MTCNSFITWRSSSWSTRIGVETNQLGAAVRFMASSLNLSFLLLTFVFKCLCVLG
jgi:hypothetical protein